MKHILRTLALPAALAATLVLASCGTSSTSTDGNGAAAMKGVSNGAPAAGAKNDADVELATMMIPHHGQAITMAEMALTQGTDPKVKALASKIKAAQGPEIVRMSGWLTGWGAPVPDPAGDSGMSGMSGMSDEAGGMMSAQQMTDLGSATGTAFDRMWLQMMVKHHEGAVAMARTALDEGTNAESKQLAQSIVDGQSTEIAQMSSILKGLG